MRSVQVKHVVSFMFVLTLGHGSASADPPAPPSPEETTPSPNAPPPASTLEEPTTLVTPAPPNPTTAQDNTPARPTSPADQEARQRYLRGIDLFDRGQLELALEEFRRAYEIAPNYRVLYNLGVVNARLGRAVEALDHLSRYLRDGGTEVPVERVVEVRASIDEQERRTALLRIRANVDGASIFVDGQAVGTSPLADPVRVTAGQHHLEATADGHTSDQTTLRLAGGEVSEHTLVLRRRTEASARLRVEGSLVDVELQVDGHRVRTTPIQESLSLAPGPHRIVLAREGYESRVYERSVEAGEIVDVDADLVPDESVRGEILLRLPEGSIVKIDGQDRGGGRMSLPPGRHLLRVEMADRETYQQEIRIGTDETTTLAPVLQWTPSARRERLTPLSRWLVAWGVTGAGVVLTVVGGVMAVGSARELNDVRVDWQAANDRLLAGPVLPADALAEQTARERYRDIQRDSRQSIIITSSLAGIGVITSVIGVVLLGKTRTEREVDLDAHVAASGEGATVGLQGRFK